MSKSSNLKLFLHPQKPGCNHPFSNTTTKLQTTNYNQSPKPPPAKNHRPPPYRRLQHHRPPPFHPKTSPKQPQNQENTIPIHLPQLIDILAELQPRKPIGGLDFWPRSTPNRPHRRHYLATATSLPLTGVRTISLTLFHRRLPLFSPPLDLPVQIEWERDRDRYVYMYIFFIFENYSLNPSF